jgi:hypothetical protein
MVMKVFEIGNNYELMIGALAVSQAFYFTILEEYYTGGLFLGYINGVTDGSIVMVGLYTYLGLFGNSVFTQSYHIQITASDISMTGGQLVVYCLMIL